ncbi:nucleotide-sugar transporter-domain-containing protein [Pisolithus microcarpus]|nr:nucleotide-sugar transporter-domain-containing protein [Pisolithus microcarpus]
MYHRAYPAIRSVSSSSSTNNNNSVSESTPRLAPLLPPATLDALSSKSSGLLLNQSPTDVAPQARTVKPATVCGLPLKYVSLVTLAVQNASLSIVMHYSRILKGSISFVIALWKAYQADLHFSSRKSFPGFLTAVFPWSAPFRQVCNDVFSTDCWKLSIPALLYFAYQMKILTTAAFSVLLLRKKLSSTKWMSLFFLAIGVAIVQVQTSGANPRTKEFRVGSAHDAAPLHVHIMSPLKGFGAVTAACFTSGLAGVYFEMVLKNSKADLDLFRHFGGWAWATVSIQVFGGLVTAVALLQSISIILSFLASVVLFDFHVTPPFLIGASTVLAATAMYNQPTPKEPAILTSGSKRSFTPLSLGKEDPILGQFSPKKSSPFGSPRAIASALGLADKPTCATENEYFTEMESTSRYLNAPYGSPFPSRTPTPRLDERT